MLRNVVCSRMLMGTRLNLGMVNNIRSRPTTPHVLISNSQNTAPYPQGAFTQPKRSCSTSNDTNNNFTRTGSYVASQSQNYAQAITKEEEPSPPPLPARPDNMGPPVVSEIYIALYACIFFIEPVKNKIIAGI